MDSKILSRTNLSNLLVIHGITGSAFFLIGKCGKKEIATGFMKCCCSELSLRIFRVPAIKKSV
jgi:hypothetical protein